MHRIVHDCPFGHLSVGPTQRQYSWDGMAQCGYLRRKICLLYSLTQILRTTV